ncbi:MAG: hypothetical protein JSS66_07155 [Armatimonadetes bacterium]|nr:hypothetical protein [Armatimonadota bacterium]
MKKWIEKDGDIYVWDMERDVVRKYVPRPDGHWKFAESRSANHKYKELVETTDWHFSPVPHGLH